MEFTGRDGVSALPSGGSRRQKSKLYKQDLDEKKQMELRVNVDVYLAISRDGGGEGDGVPVLWETKLDFA
jgi:hypothetical protein